MFATAHFDGRCAGLLTDDVNGIKFIYPEAATPAPTPAGPFVISGRISYYSDSTRSVPGVSVDLQGATPASVQTDALGLYSHGLLNGTTWQVMPRKTGDLDSGISAFDASLILQERVGLITFTPEQTLACDVSGNGTLSGCDASTILQNKVGLVTTLPVTQVCGSDWVFLATPGSATNQRLLAPQMALGICQQAGIAFEPLAGSALTQNFAALLFGDCSGNWQAPGSGAAARVVPRPAVRLGQVGHGRGHRFRIPLVMESAPFPALDVELRYDPTELRAGGVHRLAAAAGALLRSNARVPGVLKIAMASATPLPGEGAEILILQFESRNAMSARAALRSLRIVSSD